MKWFLTIPIVFILGFTASTQDPQFSQFYATPMYLNPAFVGNTDQGRITAIYRNQWPAIPKAFISYAVTYDHNLMDFNSGIGLMVIHDKAGTGGLKYTSVGGMYSYQVRLNRKVVLRPGVRASYVWRSLDADKLTFGDELARGEGFNTSESGISQRSSYLDISAGLVLYSSKFWIGAAFDHLNQPNQSLLESGEAKLPLKYSAHVGYNIAVKKGVKGKMKSNLTVVANYKAQQKWDQFDVGVYFKQEPLIFGLWYRGIPGLKQYDKGYANNDAVIAMVGVKAGSIHIAYSYDLTISRLITNTGGSHEISLIWEYETDRNRKKKRRQKFLVPCAKF
ncbi:MAG: type IX secretion system membrane protein PorP/SprF [Flavobacteriales bacterium]|nr:type IX secretion system membrane protein PorP/SprF [Flavobacteriales bacterium]